MSRHNFQVQEHVLPCSHIRGYPHATHNDEEDVLRLHIKCYTPRSTARFEPFDVTIIAAHANGVPKELYETLWDELLAYSRRSKKFRIRSIWIADVAHQGQSSVLNEGKLGNDPSWFDHPRDLFLMINHFRKAMPQPLVGIGHSMGGNNIASLALMHPRLFTSIIMLDAVIVQSPSPPGASIPAFASTYRRDLWPSRKAAREAFSRNPFYQSWDPRVFDLWIEYGLRELPTELYPEGTVVPPERKEKTQSTTASAANSLASNPTTAAVVPTSSEPDRPVTLTTPKDQEVLTFLRSKHPSANTPMSSFQPTRKSHPDIPESLGKDKPFYSSAPLITYQQLPYLRPSCLYLLGRTSTLVPIDDLHIRTASTGTGINGSGGVDEDEVRQVEVEGGHFFPFENPVATVEQAGRWLDEKIPAFRQDYARDRAEWAKVKARDKSRLSADRLWWTKHEADAMKAEAQSRAKQQGKSGSKM